MAVDDVSNDYLTFNGSTWSQPLSVGVGNANISAISCPSTSFCGAVSYYGDAQTFNGSTWSKPVLIIPKPNSNDIGLIGVSCTERVVLRRRRWRQCQHCDLQRQYMVEAGGHRRQ